MYNVNREQIERRLSFIATVANTVDLLVPSDLATDAVKRFAAERAIHLAAECVTDIGNYMIDGFVMRDASSYEDIVHILHGERVFTDDQFPFLKRLVRMRKPLVQEYDQLDVEEISRLVNELPVELPKFAESVHVYLVNELDWK